MAAAINDKSNEKAANTGAIAATVATVGNTNTPTNDNNNNDNGNDNDTSGRSVAGEGGSGPNLGMSKVFILDKYFTELQRFWDTEKRLQAAQSSSEASNLQNRLMHLSHGLEGLRQSLHRDERNDDQDAANDQNYCNLMMPPEPTTGATTATTTTMTTTGMTTSSMPGVEVTVEDDEDVSGCSSSAALTTANVSEVLSDSCEPNSIGDKVVQHNYSNVPPMEASMSSLVRPQALRPRTPPSERMRRRERHLADEATRSRLAEMHDLSHLHQPISEELIMRCLQARFFNQKYLTSVGHILVSVNAYRHVGNALTLSSTRGVGRSEELLTLVQEVVRMQSETGYPQALIVSGASGSGKTFTSMLALRYLFEVASHNGQETDTFKHLEAAFTVIRALGTARTSANREATRIGHFIEVQVSNGALYRTKIHCYLLDQSRVVSLSPMEKNYHIFYQMLAGLTDSERKQLGIHNLSVADLLYLNVGDHRENSVEDARRFDQWRSNLNVLGIPFMDVIRVLAAILLLGNVEFAPRADDDAFDVEIIGKDELNSVASLLGVPTTKLCQGLTTRTHVVRGQHVKAMSDANLCTSTRNALAKALYCRTVWTIVRRANSLKRPMGPMSGAMSSDSNESVHHELASHVGGASTIGTSGSKKSSASMALLTQAMRQTDGFIGILDMFGFEDSKPSHLEQLCINLCSETMQHFYNTHIFKSSLESCRDEGIALDMHIDYVDNVPVIDLISSLRTGLLSMLDVECSLRGFPETYVQKLKQQHKENAKLFEPKHCDSTRTFGIHHYAGDVVYDTNDFLDTNRDVIPDDLVSIFHRSSCNFGYATHLFLNEIKSLQLASSSSSSTAVRGASFRIAPSTSSHPELMAAGGDEPVSTLTQDFHTRLDNLLRTLVHAKPHFIRCIRPNGHDAMTDFDRSLVLHQIRALQLVESVNLMASGFPHRMRFKLFNQRYKLLVTPSSKLFRNEERVIDDCHLILEVYSRQLREQEQSRQIEQVLPRNTSWAHGRKHVFLSEGARQMLEKLRTDRRTLAATQIQRHWRRRRRQRQEGQRQEGQRQEGRGQDGRGQDGRGQDGRGRPRPQPIAGTPPPPNVNDETMGDKCDMSVIRRTCALFGLDLERPPPVPPSRPYTVQGNRRIAFPQTRVLKMSYGVDGLRLNEGDAVVVIGTSTRRGHLVVERHNHTFHLPHQCLEIRLDPNAERVGQHQQRLDQHQQRVEQQQQRVEPQRRRLPAAAAI